MAKVEIIVRVLSDDDNVLDEKQEVLPLTEDMEVFGDVNYSELKVEGVGGRPKNRQSPSA